MPTSKQPKQTQGHVKMLRYLEELIRNKNFIRLIKKLRLIDRNNARPEGTYYDWPPEIQAKHNYINHELSEIIKGYEALKKRCNKVMRENDFILKERIASEYGLDNDLIFLAAAMLEKNEKEIQYATVDFDDPDMCRAIDLYDEEMNPYNCAGENLNLKPWWQLSLIAFPVAIIIHPRASKRDVLDYVEKRWKWISQLISQTSEKGPLKIRKRKHGQEVIDFIWENRRLPAKQIVADLGRQFPKNDLVYYEISKIIQLEKERRYRNLT